jgi:hypothetical protein
MGPYGITTVVMINVAHLPDYVFSNIQAAASGDRTLQQTNGLTVQAVNRIFDFGSPVNKVIKNGVSQTVQDEAIKSGSEGAGAWVSSYLPGEARESISETAPKLAADLRHIVSFWTVSSGTAE